MSRAITTGWQVGGHGFSSTYAITVPQPLSPYDALLLMPYGRSGSAATEATGFSGVGGTFTRLGRRVSTAADWNGNSGYAFVELWRGVGPWNGGTSLTMSTQPGGNSYRGFLMAALRNGALLPELTVVGDVLTASGVAGQVASPGLVTPTADDESQIALHALTYETASTIFNGGTHVPGGNEQYAFHPFTTGLIMGGVMWRRVVSSLSQHEVRYTVNYPWVSLATVLQMSTPVSSDAHAYKGGDRKSLNTDGAA